jgi:hypothetical protein
MVHRTGLEGVVKGDISVLTGKRVHSFLHLFNPQLLPYTKCAVATLLVISSA